MSDEIKIMVVQPYRFNYETHVRNFLNYMYIGTSNQARKHTNGFKETFAISANTQIVDSYELGKRFSNSMQNLLTKVSEIAFNQTSIAYESTFAILLDFNDGVPGEKVSEIASCLAEEIDISKEKLHCPIFGIATHKKQLNRPPHIHCFFMAADADAVLDFIFETLT